jgi:hypothetical protein
MKFGSLCGILKTTDEASVAAFASNKACRSEPEPASSVFVMPGFQRLNAEHP